MPLCCLGPESSLMLTICIRGQPGSLRSPANSGAAAAGVPRLTAMYKKKGIGGNQLINSLVAASPATTDREEKVIPRWKKNTYTSNQKKPLHLVSYSQKLFLNSFCEWSVLQVLSDVDAPRHGRGAPTVQYNRAESRDGPVGSFQSRVLSNYLGGFWLTT